MILAALSPLTNLLILVLLAGLVYVGNRFRLQRLEERLRKNPPERRMIEVSLPVGTGNSPAEMARFFRKVSRSALGDKKARQSGLRQIDFIYLVDVQSEGATPRMRCRIQADPDQMDAVKKALTGSYSESIDILEVADDELFEVAMALCPPEEESAPEGSQ